MTAKDVRAAIEAELRDIQTSRGLRLPGLTDNTRPIGDIDEFDSYLGQDATANILIALDGAPKMKCPFSSKRNGKYLTLREITIAFCRHLNIRGM